MAGRKVETAAVAVATAEEFLESDIWGYSGTTVDLKDVGKSRILKKKQVSCSRSINTTTGVREAGAASLPVDIPDWSKTPAEGCYDEDDDVENGGEGFVPPHEYLWRRRRRSGVTSLSVHEGAGRTLKGRDLSRVRNAVWEKTGFQD